ncbi:MAG: ATP-binding cassette domain-containing protein [bacterium]|nr:ATP-binding cassette domain-containing protein [bacterium]
MIELNRICKAFDGTLAVDDVSYKFKPGGITGFLGPNGAGKSTTIRMIMNILIPDSGTIQVDGQPLSESFRNNLGYLPEERGLYKKMKVIDHLIFFGSLKGMSRSDARRKGMRWLERLDLGKRATSKVEDLSKGMQQKIQFLGTLMHDPELILLDEPFSGLDPINTEVLQKIMLDLKGSRRTVIFSTHMMDQAEQLCDNIILIDKGRIVLNGELATVRSSFGRKQLRVKFTGDTAVVKNDRRVAHFEKKAEGEVELQLHDEKDVPEVARDWSERLALHHFEVITPSLHNIFIKTVGGQGPEGGTA